MRWGYKQGKKAEGKQSWIQTEEKERTNGVHKMSNFKMSIFIFAFLISTKSYSFFLLLMFTKEMWWQRLKMKFLPYVQYTTLYNCQVQLKLCSIFPWIFILLPPTVSPPSHSHQDNEKQGFILCEQKCMKLKGNLPLVPTLSSHVNTSVGIYLLMEIWERRRGLGAVSLRIGGHHDHS